MDSNMLQLEKRSCKKTVKFISNTLNRTKSVSYYKAASCYVKLLCLSIMPFYMPHWNKHVVSDIRCYSDEEVLRQPTGALLL